MKILFIACYSPLINNSAAIETLQYLNKLSEIPENQIYLLTVNFPVNSIYYDKELEALMNKNIKVYKIDGGKLFNRMVPRVSDKKQTGSNPNNKRVIKVLRKLKNSFVIPDMYNVWANEAAKTGIELNKTVKFDVMFSMHEPPSSHICAYKIKKAFPNLKWITYWSDPWLKDSTRENSFIIKKIIEAKMEKNTVNLSDKFIFVTEQNRQDYINTYNLERDKTYLVTRGYDQKLYNEILLDQKPDLIKNDKINIIYAGEIFSKLRDINPFIEAVNQIKKENYSEYQKMNILFFGNIDDSIAKKNLEKIENAKVFGRISFNKALGFMLNSEILLLFGNRNSNQIPAKVYEYLGAKGSILTVYGDENDPLKQIVSNNQVCYNTLNKKENIKNTLLTLLRKDKKELLREPDSRYEWQNIVIRLNKILGD